MPDAKPVIYSSKHSFMMQKQAKSDLEHMVILEVYHLCGIPNIFGQLGCILMKGQWKAASVLGSEESESM